MDMEEVGQVFREFVRVIKALRTPGTGCPWDLEQDHQTLRRYLIEETCEVLDAIDRDDDRSLRDELGDLLLQVVLHAQLASDRHAFSITDVVRGITEKMVRRHPHVFGSAQVSSSAEVSRNWEQIKAAENQEKGNASSPSLEGLPESLPALLRAQRLGEKAARSHFDSGSIVQVLDQAREEFTALEAEVRGAVPGQVTPPVEKSLGSLLFNLCQLARWLGLSAEDSLRVCARRFTERFRRMETQIPRPLDQLSREELEAAWQQAKEPGPT